MRWKQATTHTSASTAAKGSRARSKRTCAGSSGRRATTITTLHSRAEAVEIRPTVFEKGKRPSDLRDPPAVDFNHLYPLALAHVCKHHAKWIDCHAPAAVNVAHLVRRNDVRAVF